MFLGRTFFTGLISFAVVFRSRTTENKEVSSAKPFGFEGRFSAKSLIQIKNNSGPKIEPWGKPPWIFFQLDVCPLRTTLYFLFLKQSSKIFSKLPDIPFCFNLKTRPSCITLSNAFDISRNTPRIS